MPPTFPIILPPSAIAATNACEPGPMSISPLAALDMANGDIDLGPASQAFLSQMADGGNPLGRAGGMLMLVAALGIAVIPLWVKTND